MSLSPGSRRVDDFAKLVDNGARTNDPNLAPYVAVAQALRAVPAPAGPSEDFSAALRQRLVAVATVQGVGPQPTSPTARLREIGGTWRFQRRLAAVAGAAAAATAIAGVGLGASRSLPGEPLYGVKRATEQVQLAATFGTEAKGERHLEFAQTRLSEVRALAGEPTAIGAALPGTATALGSAPDQGRTDLIISTLADMNSETRAGSTDLISVFQSTGATAPLQTLNSFSRDQYAQLRSLAPALPADARPMVKSSLRLLSAVGSQTLALAKAAVRAGPASHQGGKKTSGQHHGTGGHSNRPKPSSTPSSGSTPSTTPSTSGSNGGSTSYPTAPPKLPTDLPTVTLPDLSPSPSYSPPTILPTDAPTLPGISVPTLPQIGN